MTFEERVTMAISATVCMAIGAILMWAHLGTDLDGCREEQAGLQILSEAQQRLHEEDLLRWQTRSITDLAARRVAEQQLKATQQELGVVMAQAHNWTTPTGESVFDPPGLTRFQVLEHLAKEAGRKVLSGIKVP